MNPEICRLNAADVHDLAGYITGKPVPPVLTPEDEIEHCGNSGRESETATMALRLGAARVGGVVANGEGV